jgi:glycosyltransferase involved in cell wall biosynthesis
LGLGCPKEKLVYNVYGPKNGFLDIKPKFTKLQFISIGRFVDKKAPYYTILAFKKVQEEFPEAKLIMAGNGSLLNMCKNLVRYYKLEDSVEFTGIITPKMFMVYLKESLAFVQHSITAENGDAEGTPVAILEASAAGIAVVSTIHAGIPDVIEDGRTGLLVQEHDVMGMARNMIRLIEEPNLAQELGSKGKENIKNNFTLQRHIDVLDSLIEKCTT